MKQVIRPVAVILAAVLAGSPALVQAEGTWEVTPESEAALEAGLEWLAQNQGPKGNWDDQNLGLVSMGLLAYLSAGHLPGRGKYGDNVQRALDYIINNAQPSGLLNIAVRGHDMYNHGLATFVLGQVYGMTGDKRVGRVLDGALRLIQESQCGDGGWDYVAISKPQGHDLSLCVMQAKALRSAMDSGFKVEPIVVNKAVAAVRKYYIPNFAAGVADPQLSKGMSTFSYNPNDRSRASITMTAVGVVCLQEFGQYDDPRIEPAMRYIRYMVQRGEAFFNEQYRQSKSPKHKRQIVVPTNHVPFDAYTLYYLGQAIYQRGGEDWKICYPILRDQLVKRQRIAPGNIGEHGTWVSNLWEMSGKESQLYGTAIGCFYLAMPNRYLPILQEGRIESLVRPVEGPKREGNP
jgi:hypothetical protein